MRRPLTASIVLGLIAAGCGAPTVVPTSDTVQIETITPVPGASSLERQGAEVIVGGIEVDTMPGAAATPALDRDAALRIVADELTAGRARMIGRHADSPVMNPVDAAFVPGLVRVVSPAGGTDFSVREPVAAWVVVSQGRGSDGLYIAVGIVGDDGRPLATYVITPGVG